MEGHSIASVYYFIFFPSKIHTTRECRIEVRTQYTAFRINSDFARSNL